MNKDRYNTLKNALIVEKNDELLEEFKKLMKSMDEEENDKYLKEYNGYDYMALTLEEEEIRLSNIINLIKQRELEHNEYEDDYSYIVGSNPGFLTQIVNIDKLRDLEQRLNIIRDYLAVKERIVNLSVNIKEYKKILSNDKSNRRIQTKLNKSTKKINDLLNSLKKENMLILLYEFCLIDTFDKNKVDNSVMLKNILSTKLKKKEEKVKPVVEVKNEPTELEMDNIVKEELSEESSNDSTNIKTEDDSKILDSSDNYVKNMIPDGMPMLEQIGTVKPVSIMEKLEKAQEETENLTIPSMGMLDNHDTVDIDSNDYVKNVTKSDKIS